MPINKPKSEYGYNDWFNHYLEKQDQFGFLGTNKKRLGNDDWKSAHEYAKKQLKRYASRISGEDRQRLASDDRAAHEIYDAMDPRNGFNMSDMFGGNGGVGDLSLGLNDDETDDRNDNSYQRKQDKDEPETEKEPEDDISSDEEDDGLTETDNTGNNLEDESLEDEPESGEEDPGTQGESGAEGNPVSKNSMAESGEGLGEAAEGAAGAAEGTAAAAEGAAAAAEGAAAAAEGAAVAAEGTAVAAEGLIAFFSTPVGWVVAVILIILFVLLFLWLGTTMATAYPGADDKPSTSVCANTSSLGSPNSGGYYQLPESKYYTLNSNGGSPRDQQWGNKDTVELILNVGKTWSSSHSDQLFSIGDINASGHASHKVGIDFDVYNNRNKLFKKNPGGSDNPNYDKALTIGLGKLFLDTNAIEYIFYDDPDVVSALTKYIKDNKLSGVVEPWEDNHWDHFHVRVKKGAYVCKDSDAGSGAPIVGALDVPYQNQFQYGHDGACAITSLAMVASYYKKETVTEDAVYKAIGINYQLSYLNKLVKSSGVQFTRLTIGSGTTAEDALQKASQSIKKGNPVVVRLNPPFAESIHTAIITGFDDDGNVYVNDPNNSRGAPPYKKTGSPKGKNNLAPRDKFKGAMIYIDYVK